MPNNRNELCPCSSGKKYKKCHGKPGQQMIRTPEVMRAEHKANRYYLKQYNALVAKKAKETTNVESTPRT
jgi:uncharacterized protein YecA (UPF0149 family)